MLFFKKPGLAPGFFVGDEVGNPRRPFAAVCAALVLLAAACTSAAPVFLSSRVIVRDANSATPADLNVLSKQIGFAITLDQSIGDQLRVLRVACVSDEDCSKAVQALRDTHRFSSVELDRTRHIAR